MFLLSLSLLVFGTGAVPAPRRGQGVAFSAVQNQTFDYVIAGGGLTGLVVANRLSEDRTSLFATV